jgi:hypothetical protein
MALLKLSLIAAVMLGIGMLGIAIKIWGKKDGKIAGTCASQSPFLNQNGENCSYCGKEPSEQCAKD